MIVFITYYSGVFGQDTIIPHTYTYADSLHGMLRTERTCYKTLHYDLVLKIDMDNKAIIGYSDMLMNVVYPTRSLQIDLYPNFQIDSLLIDYTRCTYKRVASAIFITLPVELKKGTTHHIRCYYKGTPHIALNAPWDGGFVWQKDFNDKPWLGVACQLNGACIWWPCKDHPSDEPENGVDLYYDVPDPLKAIGNGKLINVNHYAQGRTLWHWKVSYPINLYDVTLNVADYAHMKDYYINAKNDTLPLDYYVLKENEYKAKLQFQQVKTMMACFEMNFGAYPFYKDGYKLVESSYWGMEHQSCVAYGNNYKNNGFGFDFIIIHESAHEWWGNNLSASDNADDWLHESFATYAEALYIECMQGHEKYLEYLKQQKWMIKNKFPIIGRTGVYYNAPDNDLYFKGTWMLHTFRSVLNNDSLFFAILHHLQSKFGYLTTNTDEVIEAINRFTHNNYTPFFNQYLRYANLPKLQYRLHQKGKNLVVDYRWKAEEQLFNMPIEISSGYTSSNIVENKQSFHRPKLVYTIVHPNSNWQTLVLHHFKRNNFKINEDKYLLKGEQL